MAGVLPVFSAARERGLRLPLPTRIECTPQQLARLKIRFESKRRELVFQSTRAVELTLGVSFSFPPTQPVTTCAADEAEMLTIRSHFSIAKLARLWHWIIHSVAFACDPTATRRNSCMQKFILEEDFNRVVSSLSPGEILVLEKALSQCVRRLRALRRRPRLLKVTLSRRRFHWN